MPNEMITRGLGGNRPSTLAARGPLTFLLRAGWILGKLTLAGLLVTYMAGWIQDLQRLSQLEAQPTPPFKVISKTEAWQRIHKRSLEYVLANPITLAVSPSAPSDEARAASGPAQSP